MADFETQIRESQDQVARAQAKISEITGKIETARSKLDAGEVAIDIENATLEDVHQHTDLMNANIAELIMGLDDVTAGFSKDFDEMRSKTGMESVIGFFSSAKSESMVNRYPSHQPSRAGTKRRGGIGFDNASRFMVRSSIRRVSTASCGAIGRNTWSDTD